MTLNRTILGILTAAILGFPAYSASLLFDNADPPLTTTNRVNSLEGAAAYLQIGSANVTISQIAINARPAQDGQLKFVIFTDVIPPGSDAGRLLFSDTVNVSSSGTLSYIFSDPFSFTLQAGRYYDIGAIFSGSSIAYTYDFTSDAENGITSLVSNENVDQYDAPVLAGHAASDINVRLYGTASVVPEPATPLLFFVGLLAAGFAAARSRDKQVTRPDEAAIR